MELKRFPQFNDGQDWIWILDKAKKEKYMASDFERLSRKYAVIFKSIGFKAGDVLHFVVNDNHYQIFFATGGVWHLGGKGSLPGISKSIPKCILFMRESFWTDESIDKTKKRYQI